MSLASFQRKVNTYTEDEKGQPEEEQETGTLVSAGLAADLLRELSRHTEAKYLWAKKDFAANVD